MVCSFAFTFGLVYLKACAISNHNIDDALPLTPANTVIVFDLHRVLFHHNYRRMWTTFYKSPLKWRFAIALLNPCLLWDMVKLLYRRPIPESFFVHLSHNYKNIRDIMPLLIEIANQQIRNEKTIAIVKELKEQGFELAILSNIGQRIFDALRPKHQDLFSLFNHIIVATAETQYASKPNPKIYERLHNELNRNKHVVLIDDQEKNICGGLSFGIIGIVYKQPKQLCNQLKKLGILVHPPRI
jgi:HAD superfamily hydrolase (TIGR01509 family)